MKLTVKIKLFYLKYNIFRCFDRRGRNPVIAVFWFWLSGSVSGVMITRLVYNLLQHTQTADPLINDQSQNRSQ